MQPRTLLTIAALGFFLYAVLDRLVARHDCEGQAGSRARHDRGGELFRP